MVPSWWERKGSKIVFYDNNDNAILRLPGDDVVEMIDDNEVADDTKGAIFIKKDGNLCAYTLQGELIKKRSLSMTEKMFGAEWLEWWKTFAFKY